MSKPRRLADQGTGRRKPPAVEAIRKIVLRLPCAPDADVEGLVRSISNALAIADSLEGFRPSTPKQAAEEVVRVRKALAGLRAATGNLSAIANREIENAAAARGYRWRMRHKPSLYYRLRTALSEAFLGIDAALDDAEAALRARAQIRSEGGRPKRSDPDRQRVVQALARVYERATGRPPPNRSVEGPWGHFVRDVFELVGLPGADRFSQRKVWAREPE